MNHISKQTIIDFSNLQIYLLSSRSKEISSHARAFQEFQNKFTPVKVNLLQMKKN
jgi:hypothetical protein